MVWAPRSADPPTYPIHTAADSFNRWEAGQVLAKTLMRALYAAASASNAVSQRVEGVPAEAATSVNFFSCQHSGGASRRVLSPTTCVHAFAP